MITNPTVPVLDDPQLEDKVFKTIGDKLVSGISWLNACYGKAKKVPEKMDNRTIFRPMIYIGGNTNRGYLSLFPDSHLGNYCFFHVDDNSQAIEAIPKQGGDFELKIRIIFWGNIESVYPATYTTKSEQNIKKEVFDFLTTKSFPGSNLEIVKPYDTAENIFRGYTFDEVKEQFLIRPFFGFAFEAVIRFNEIC